MSNRIDYESFMVEDFLENCTDEEIINNVYKYFDGKNNTYPDFLIDKIKKMESGFKYGQPTDNDIRELGVGSAPQSLSVLASDALYKEASSIHNNISDQILKGQLKMDDVVKKMELVYKVLGNTGLYNLVYTMINGGPSSPEFLYSWDDDFLNSKFLGREEEKEKFIEEATTVAFITAAGLKKIGFDPKEFDFDVQVKIDGNVELKNINMEQLLNNFYTRFADKLTCNINNFNPLKKMSGKFEFEKKSIKDTYTDLMTMEIGDKPNEFGANFSKM